MFFQTSLNCSSSGVSRRHQRGMVGSCNQKAKPCFLQSPLLLCRLLQYASGVPMKVHREPTSATLNYEFDAAKHTAFCPRGFSSGLYLAGHEMSHESLYFFLIGKTFRKHQWGCFLRSFGLRIVFPRFWREITFSHAPSLCEALLSYKPCQKKTHTELGRVWCTKRWFPGKQNGLS